VVEGGITGKSEASAGKYTSVYILVTGNRLHRAGRAYGGIETFTSYEQVGHEGNDRKLGDGNTGVYGDAAK